MAGDAGDAGRRPVIAAGRAVGERRRAPRLALLATIGAAHVAAIWLLLQSGLMPSVSPTQPLLTLFDVAPPPPPPPPPAPEPPPSPRRITERPGGAGSPGVERQKAAATVDPPALPARETIDVTPLPPLPISPPAFAGGTAPIDLGSGGASGVGTGAATGAGLGSGDGRGDGSGDGSARYARARWIVRPTDADFRRVWPTRTVDGKAVLQNGWAYLECKVRPDGRPYDCRALHESPASIGMGAAAIAVVARSRVKPVSRNKLALLEVPVLIPVVFRR